jgi:hypothetical protein
MNHLFLGTLAASLLALGSPPDARAIAPRESEARVTVTLTGKLVLTDPSLPDILTHIRYDATIESGGQTFHLKGARLLPAKLNGKEVTVRGRLVWGATDLTRPSDLVPVVVVEDCQPAEKLPVVVLAGRLETSPGEGKSLPPVKSYRLTIDGKTYDLAVNDKDLRDQLGALTGSFVKVTGTLQANGVVVSKVERVPEWRHKRILPYGKIEEKAK